MSIDVIGNFLTIIRNGVMRSKPSVSAPYSKMKHAVADILKEEGFITDVVIDSVDNRKVLKVVLKYVGGESVIHEIKRESTPGRRIYTSSRQIKPVVGNLGMSILTTNKGVVSDKKARQSSLGGEVICTVW
jgi:small subunit ribosomal protein S8